LADAQYWNVQHMRVLIPPDSGMRRTHGRAGPAGAAAMRNALLSPTGKELCGKRKQMIEPVFAHTKHNRRHGRVGALCCGPGMPA
jgi:hypothetical protein